MLELTALSAFIGYLIYLRYYADQRTNAEKEADRLREGIDLYESQEYAKALTYFSNAIDAQPKSAVAYLYRARCYRALGNEQAALTDLERGKSYDDTVSELHLDTGKLHFDQRNYQAAFQDFDKAIFFAHGDTPEPYQWRGLTREQLGRPTEAQQDIAKAEQITQLKQQQSLVIPEAPKQFFDRRLALNAGLTLVTSAILLLIIKLSPVIHWPYLWAASSAMGIGFAEPRKGWSLAILQALSIIIGYYLIVGPSPSSTHREVETFSLFGSVGLTFAGSLIGSVLKRAQH
jgi:tetratricopeptide (TPR) repeat protein